MGQLKIDDPGQQTAYNYGWDHADKELAEPLRARVAELETKLEAIRKYAADRKMKALEKLAAG